MPRGLVTRFLVTFFGRWRAAKGIFMCVGAKAFSKPVIEPQKMEPPENGRMYATGLKLKHASKLQKRISLFFTDKQNKSVYC